MKGSRFPNEYYHFSGDKEEDIVTFTDMLKSRGCYISEDGHIRSPKGVLKSKLLRNGYYMTSAQYKGDIHYFLEHRVVWVWHNGQIPAGMVVNHKDFNKANNRIENLEVMTQKENVEYSRCNFNPKRGEESVRSIFTNKQAEAIKAIYHLCGCKAADIAAFVKTSTTTINRVANGQRYPDAVTPDTILCAYPTLVDFTRNIALSEEEELKDYLLGLNGEVGELTDIFKKILYHGKEYDPVDICLELGDIMYYCVAIMNVLGIDATEVLLNNNAKLISRYPNGFSVEASLNRIEEHKERICDIISQTYIE